MKRREFLQASAATSGAALIGNSLHASAPVRLGKAEHCVMLWLGGGMSQIDTFDPKRRGDAKQKKAGSYYAAIDTSVPGVQVCEHLSKTARMMENVTAIRTLNHDVVDEHAAAANRMHTGRATGGTVTYPSLGSIVADQPLFRWQPCGHPILFDRLLIHIEQRVSFADEVRAERYPWLHARFGLNARHHQPARWHHPHYRSKHWPRCW